MKEGIKSIILYSVILTFREYKSVKRKKYQDTVLISRKEKYFHKKFWKLNPHSSELVNYIPNITGPGFKEETLLWVLHGGRI